MLTIFHWINALQMICVEIYFNIKMSHICQREDAINEITKGEDIIELET